MRTRTIDNLVADWLMIWTEFKKTNSFLHFKLEKDVHMNSDQFIDQSATRLSMVQVLIHVDQIKASWKPNRNKWFFVDMNSDHFRVHFCFDLYVKWNFRQQFYNRRQNTLKSWSAKRNKCASYSKRKIQVSKILKLWYYRILILKKK